MKTSEVTYTGNLRTRATHIRSGEKIITDAPVDNNGRGEAFSPTDLMATSLASCMITIMGIKAANMGIEFNTCRAEVVKIMTSEPRRVSEIQLEIVMDASLSLENRKSLELAAINCPVAKSLHPDIKQNLKFIYQ